MRKHIQQMDPTERAFIHGYIRSNSARLTGCSHYYDRASDRNITLQEAITAAQTGLVIEVNDNPGYRALVRSKTGVCAVISLQTLTVVTVYYNSPEDTHSTLNWNAYQWEQNIAELVKKVRSL